MEKQSKILILLLVAFVVCMGVFWFQFNNNVSTFMILNETEVSQDGSFAGMLMDAYSYGVPNQTISFQNPNNEIINVTTDENGEFKVLDVESGSGDRNCYDNFTFSGNGKYMGCTYEGNVTVKG